MRHTLTLSKRFQGATGKGHGGYTAGLMAEYSSGRMTVDFHRSIPLGVEVELELTDGATWLRYNGDDIVRLRPSDRAIRIPEPVSTADAAAAQARSPVQHFDVLPDCFSCGTLPDSMNVHAGPLEGRPDYATTWTPEPRHADGDEVLARYVWGAIDCPSGWVLGTFGDDFVPSVTGEMWAEVFAPVRPGVTYAIVAWGQPWRGRRATAGSALFDKAGACLAASESMWVTI